MAMIDMRVETDGKRYRGKVQVNVPKRRYRPSKDGKPGHWHTIRPHHIYFTRWCYNHDKANERMIKLASTIKVEELN